MKVSFRCKLSGNVVTFHNEQDIDWMRKEVGYEEIKDESKAEANAKQESRESPVGNPDESNDAEDEPKNGNDEQKDAKVLKKRGRPRTAY